MGCLANDVAYQSHDHGKTNENTQSSHDEDLIVLSLLFSWDSWDNNAMRLVETPMKTIQKIP